eukprot:SAG31_NODE_14709_length_791_cov_1.200867_1_plen_72_part_10
MQQAGGGSAIQSNDLNDQSLDQLIVDIDALGSIDCLPDAVDTVASICVEGVYPSWDFFEGGTQVLLVLEVR